MVKEVEDLIASGVAKAWLLGLGLEYRFVTQYVLKEMTYPEMVERLKYAIHDYARRQITYFKRWPEAQWASAEDVRDEIMNKRSDLLKVDLLTERVASKVNRV